MGRQPQQTACSGLAMMLIPIPFYLRGDSPNKPPVADVAVRRRLGIATLALACVFMALWLKSRDQTDFVWFSCRFGSVWFLSGDGIIRVMAQFRNEDDVPPEGPAPPIGWRSITNDRDQTIYYEGRTGAQISRAQLDHIKTNMLARIEYAMELEWTKRSQIYGFDFGTYRLTHPSLEKHAPFYTFSGHYWSTVAALTLASAWLLCSSCSTNSQTDRESRIEPWSVRRMRNRRT